MPDMNLMTRGLEKAIKSANAAQKARMDFQMDLTLNKIKQQQAQQERQWKMQYDLMAETAKKSIMSPLEQIQMEQYKREQGAGQTQGQPIMPNEQPVTAPLKIEGGKFKRMGLKDMAEQVYMKPQDTWTERDKQIVAQYSQMQAAGRAPRSSSGGDDMLARIKAARGQTSNITASSDNTDIDSFLSQF